MQYGLLSLLPPLIAIIIAIRTKQILLSLFVGIWVGNTIIHHWNPVVGFIKVIPDFLVPSIADPFNASLLILVTLAGGFIHVLRITGGAKALSVIISKRVNTRKKAQTLTWASAFLFSYTEPVLILGTIMRPLTEKVNVSRVKLAYILDSMGTSVASMSPISGYAPFLTGLIGTQLTVIGLAEEPWDLYFKMLPYNLYGIFVIFTVFFVVQSNLDIGRMFDAEKRAFETGKLIGENDSPILSYEENEKITSVEQISLLNFVLPMAMLLIAIFGVIFWTGDIFKNNIRETFLHANIVLAVSCGFIAGSLGAAILALKAKVHTVTSIFEEWNKGVINLMIVPMILILAWSIGKVTTDMKLGEYIAHGAGSYLPMFLIPAAIFALGAITSFGTGSSWGVFALMMPVVIPLAHTLDMSLPIVIGAVVSGGLFGDHCSPISDTAVLASTVSACDHIEHVRTQLPYACIVGFSSFFGFFTAGITNSNLLSLATTAILIIISLGLLNRRKRKAQSNAINSMEA